MEEVSLSSPELADAVRVWTGWGRYISPRPDDRRLLKHYGPARGAELLRIIEMLKNDFYKSDARFAAKDLAEMASLSSQHFVEEHPGVADDIVKALAWCYTFDYK